MPGRESEQFILAVTTEITQLGIAEWLRFNPCLLCSEEHLIAKRLSTDT
jgi:hypothetical protein